MVIPEQIQQHVQRLSVAYQAEVLDFVEHLVGKVRSEEDPAWSDLSLTFALRGLEDEATPRFASADLKVVLA